MTIRRALLPLAATLALLLAPAAQAKSPPNGDYGCTYTTFSGTFYAGTLNIKSKTKYSVNDKKKGEYTTRDRRIKFKTGDYKGLWRGKWRKGQSVIDGSTYHVIKLISIEDPEGTPTLECSRDRS